MQLQLDGLRAHRFNSRSFSSPHGQVAQLVEQRTENPRVGSSILPLATRKFKDSCGIALQGLFYTEQEISRSDPTETSLGTLLIIRWCSVRLRGGPPNK